MLIVAQVLCMLLKKDGRPSFLDLPNGTFNGDPDADIQIQRFQKLTFWLFLPAGSLMKIWFNDDNDNEDKNENNETPVAPI